MTGRMLGGPAIGSRPTGIRHPRNIFVITEGITESQYLDDLKQLRMLSDCVILKHVAKYGIDRDESNRMNMAYLARDDMLFRHEGRCTPYKYVTTVLNDFYYQFKGDIIPAEADDVVSDLRIFRDELVEDYSDDLHTDGLLVLDESDSDRPLYKDIEDECNYRYRIPDEDRFVFSRTDDLSGTGRALPNEEVYVMFDRDYSKEYFDKPDYDAVIDVLREMDIGPPGKSPKFRPLVTSPKFEFWLMMHVEGVDFGKPSYRPTYNNHIALELVVRGGDPDANPGCKGEKFMPLERFEAHYKNGVRQAVRLALTKEGLSRDVDELENHAGTNLGEFFNGILLPYWGYHP